MPLTENDFASIKTLIDSAVGEIGQTFITGEVIKRDDQRKLIWIKELGDQPIPVVDFKNMVDVYSNVMPATEIWHEVGTAGEPAFVNGWRNYDAANYQTAGFKKDAFGFVHLKGLVSTGTLDIAAFTLPVGYRPASFVHEIILSTNVAGGIRIVGITGASPGQSGQVILGTPGITTWFALDGVNFAAEPPPTPQIQKRSETSNVVVPAQGATVVVALERGTRRLPRCLGEIQSTEYIRSGDD
jgi:hypothetical protein